MDALYKDVGRMDARLNGNRERKWMLSSTWGGRPQRMEDVNEM